MTTTTLVDFDDSYVFQRRNDNTYPWMDWATAPSDKEEAEVVRQRIAKQYPNSEWRVVRKVTTVVMIEED